jgi:hypothetical protein
MTLGTNWLLWARISARVSQQRLHGRGQLDNRGQLSEEVGRGCNGAVSEGSEILERNAFPDPLGSAGQNTDALRIRSTVHDRTDVATLAVPPVGETRQPGPVGDGEQARGSDPNNQHVAERGRHSEPDVQRPGKGVGNKEVIAVALAPEGAQPGGAQIAFDQVRAERLIRHEIYAAVGKFVHPLTEQAGTKESGENSLCELSPLSRTQPTSRAMSTIAEAICAIWSGGQIYGGIA